MVTITVIDASSGGANIGTIPVSDELCSPYDITAGTTSDTFQLESNYFERTALPIIYVGGNRYDIRYVRAIQRGSTVLSSPITVSFTLYRGGASSSVSYGRKYFVITNTSRLSAGYTYLFEIINSNNEGIGYFYATTTNNSTQVQYRINGSTYATRSFPYGDNCIQPIPQNVRDGLEATEEDKWLTRYSSGWYYLTGWEASGGQSGTRSFTDEKWMVNPSNSNTVYMDATDAKMSFMITCKVYTNTNTYTEYFHNGSGWTTDSSARCPSGTTVTLPGIGTRPHYHYTAGSEWYVGYVGYRSAGSTFTLNEDIRYSTEAEPQWTADTYTVTYNPDGGSVSPTQVTVTYPASVTLPSNATKANYLLNKWSDGTNQYDPGASYQPLSNITLIATWSPMIYQVTLKDADGTTINTQSVTYPASANLTSVSHSAFTFLGWYKEGTTTQVANASATTYQPSGNVSGITIYRRYSWSRKLYNQSVQYGEISGYYPKDATYSNPTTVALPTESSSSKPTRSGYRIAGWGYNQSTSSFTELYTPELSNTNTILYVVWTLAQLTGLSINQFQTIIQKGDVVTASVTVTPSDWIGDTSEGELLTWSVDKPAYFTVTRSQDGRSASIKAKASTASLTVKPKLTVSKGSISASVYIQCTEDIPVAFYSRNNSGVQYLVGTYYVNDYTHAWSSFPSDPSRAGMAFAGWLDEDEVKVTQSAPPTHKTNCYATWLIAHTEDDHDHLYLQRLNSAKDGMVLQLDMGVVTEMQENFTPSLTATPTPTQSSENTFISDLYCLEEIPFSFTRKNPTNWDDNSDNPRDWSNGKWIQTVRDLVDRWQSETDGCKILFVPRNLEIKTFDGETIAYGPNYDLIGEARTTGLGLIFNVKYRLMGFNGLIGSYSDDWNGGVPDIITGSITIGLGGMLSNYVSW